MVILDLEYSSPCAGIFLEQIFKGANCPLCGLAPPLENTLMCDNLSRSFHDIYNYTFYDYSCQTNKHQGWKQLAAVNSIFTIPDIMHNTFLDLTYPVPLLYQQIHPEECVDKRGLAVTVFIKTKLNSHMTNINCEIRVQHIR